MNPNYCARRCDCSHPSECIFNQPEVQRPSFAIVWIVGAAMVAVAVIVLLVVLL